MTFAGYWGKRYFEIMHDYSEPHALFLMALFWAGYLIMSLLVGPISKKIIKKETLIVILALLGVCTSVVITLPILYSYSVLVVLIFLLGTSIAGIILGFSIISEAAPTNIKGSAIATNNTVLVLGGLVGQYIFGLLLTYDGLITIIPTEINPYYYSGILLLPISAIIAFAAILYGTIKHSK
jgi:MFS family permease